MRHIATYLVIALFVAFAVAGVLYTLDETDPTHFYE